MRMVYLNGRLVPEAQAVVPVSDRGLLYGDGLFETLRISQGQPFRWTAHWERLKAGAEFLRIPLPFSESALLSGGIELAARNNVREATLRLTLTRGTGRRGYSTAGAEHPNCVMSTHELPERPAAWRLATVSIRLPAGDPLARYKTCNKLLQILARKEAEGRGADEALLLNSMGVVAEAAAANIFWIQAGAVCTPPLTAGVLPGVTRAVVMELCEGLSLPVRECEVGREALFQAEGVFLTLSSLGVMPVASLDDAALGLSRAVAQLAAHYDQRVYAETTKNRS